MGAGAGPKLMCPAQLRSADDLAWQVECSMQIAVAVQPSAHSSGVPLLAH